MKQFCLKLRSIFMLLCVCISVPLFTSCSEDEGEGNGIVGYWAVTTSYGAPSNWANDIRSAREYGEQLPYQVAPNGIHIEDGNTLNYVEYLAYTTKRSDAIATRTVDGKTYYIAPRTHRTTTYAIKGNVLYCVSGSRFTIMSDGSLYENDVRRDYTKIK